MRLLLVLCVFCIAPISAFAYEVTVTEVDAPYKNVPIGTYSGEEHVLLGELSAYPVMYEFMVLEEAQPFTMRVRQAYGSAIDPSPFSLLLVRVQNAGTSVREVGRVRTEADEWTVVKDSALGLTFFEGNVFSADLATGTYRVEVSTPVNDGRYALMLGSAEGDAGYFTTLGNIRTTQSHFGYSLFRILASPYVFYPLGVILLSLVFWKTWQYRKLISNVG